MTAEGTFDRPEWWEWSLELTAHAKSRMEERGVADVELRAMLEDATGLEPSRKPGRWVVITKHKNTPWHIVVEPNYADRLLQVVTVYPRIALS